jgi:hypothetical protein
MKKIILALLLFLNSLSYSQTIIGENYELIKNREVVYLGNSFTTQYGTDKFYIDSLLTKKYAALDYKNTPSDSVVNKKFKVLNFEKRKHPIFTSSFDYVLKLQNDRNKIIFFKYDIHTEDLRLIGDMIYPDGFFCKKIESDKDKFSGITTHRSPLLDVLSFSKSKGVTYLRIDIPGSTLNYNTKGVILLLSDGSKINKPNEKIDVDYNNGYRYSAFIALSKIEIDKIIKNPISDVKLYIYDFEIVDKQKYSEYLKCLSKM